MNHTIMMNHPIMTEAEQASVLACWRADLAAMENNTYVEPEPVKRPPQKWYPGEWVGDPKNQRLHQKKD